MGGGSSSLLRCRKIIVIRAYNARRPEETLSEQFEKLSKIDGSGRKVLAVQDIKVAISLDQSWFDDLIVRICSGNDTLGEVDFASFIEFLDSGSVPIISAGVEPKKPPAARGALSSLNGQQVENVQPPPGPPMMGFSPLQTSGSAIQHPPAAAIARRVVKENCAPENEALYPDVSTCLGFKEPTACRELWRHPGTTVSLTPADAYRRPGPQRPLWRKRETVVHERIVQYTTVVGTQRGILPKYTPAYSLVPRVRQDAEGVVQELIESEKSQNEIVHLECKETGEFAHRESSQFESVETFNKEIVAEERGDETYIHLKSKDDEYEHIESNMPASRTQPPPDEAAAQEEAEAAAAAQAIDEAVQQAASEGAPSSGGALGEDGMRLDAIPEGPASGVNSEEAPISQEVDGAPGWWREEGQVEASEDAGDSEAPFEPVKLWTVGNPDLALDTSPDQAEVDGEGKGAAAESPFANPPPGGQFMGQFEDGHRIFDAESAAAGLD